MSLVTRYAKVISTLAKEGGTQGADKLVAYMKHRGHLSYLPQAIRLAEADMSRDTGIIVTVAKADDATRYAVQIASALKELGLPAQAGAGNDEYRIVIDEKIVGGTLVSGRGRVIDNSHRSRLVSIYHSVI